MNLADLKKPFPPDRISWRVGSTTKDKTKGMALAYIDARDVQDRLDEVCGVINWQCRYPHANGKTVCEVGIRTDTHEWIWKSDGAGDSDIEAEKGALSDAFKRAAVRWGVGRYLYDLESPWVALDEHKRILPAEFKRLESLLAGKGGNGANAQRDAIHGTKPKDADIDEGVKNWCDLQKGKITAAVRLPDLYMWLDESDPALDRLRRKAPEAHADLTRFYQAKLNEISKKVVTT